MNRAFGIKVPVRESVVPGARRSPSKFMFATGIECSYPTIRDRTPRMDQLSASDHYRRWREDLQLTQDLGVRMLRYGVPYHRINTASGCYD